MTRATLILVFRGLRRIWEAARSVGDGPMARAKLYLNGADYDRSIQVNGPITVIVTRKGRLDVGRNVRINSGEHHNIIGRPQKTVFWVHGELEIGEDVGLSGTAIICMQRVVIGARTKIGGGTVIYDTDFHSLDAAIRSDRARDLANARRRPVSIGEDVFIGAHTTILKGVTIGDRAVVGACSVVTRDIPPDEIWAGNPAAFVRTLDASR